MPLTPEEWLAEFTVNASTFGDQSLSDITQLNNGNILISYTSDGTGGGGTPAGDDILGQMFDVLGNPIGSEFILNQFIQGSDETRATVTALSNGGFMVVNESNDTDNDLIYSTFNSTGAAVNSGYIVNDAIGGTIYGDPTVVSLNSTSVMIAYHVDNGGGDEDVVARIYNPQTNVMGAEFTIFNGAPGAGEGVGGFDVAALDNNTYAVVVSNENAGADSDLFVSRYDVSGAQLGSSFFVIADNLENYDPSIIGLTSGRFVVSWTTNDLGGDIRYRVFDNAGTAVSNVLNPQDSSGGGQSGSTTIALADGTFVVAWDHGTTLRMQHLDASGGKLGSEFTFETNGSSRELSGIGLDDGRFQLTWTISGSGPGGNILSEIFDTRDFANTNGSHNVGTIGHDTFTQSGGATAYGWDGNDIITENTTGAAADIYGGNGNDTIIISVSTVGETFDGGLGGDTLAFMTTTQDLVVDLSSGMFGADILVDIEHVSGSNGDDTLTGNSSDNTLRGSNGNDTLYGAADDDDLYGFNGNDSLYGGDDDDSLHGDSGDDILFGGDGNDYLSGGAGSDVINGGDGSDRFGITDSNDALNGDGGNDTFEIFDPGTYADLVMNGGAGTDRLYMFRPGVYDLSDIDNELDSVETIEFGIGVVLSHLILSSSAFATFAPTTTIRSRSSADDRVQIISDGITALDISGWAFQFWNIGLDEIIFTGAVQDDTFTGSIQADIINGDAGADMLNGHNGNDLINGGAGDDILSGGQGSDDLNGDDGADTLQGDAADDTLSGGAGDDILIGGQGSDNIDGGAGLDTASYVGSAEGVTINLSTGNNSGGDAKVDTLTSIENLIGSAFDDSLAGDGNDNSIEGGTGADIINGGAGDDILNGGAGDDIIYGQGDNDMLTGGDGADTMRGGLGNDIHNGDAGDDFINGQGGDDTINGGDGEDNLLGASGNDSIDGDLGNDVVNGNGGDDIVNGGEGNDDLRGAVGFDTINGGNGDDIVSGGNQNDTINGDAGADTLNGDAGNDIVNGGADNDTLIGASGQDVLNGDAGDDNLSGSAGGDDLFGGIGNDTLDGGGGNDDLNGGAGSDIFVANLGFRTDRIQDFEDGVDLIDFSANVLANNITDVLAAATQVGANVRIDLNANNALILENFDLKNLDATDFIF